MNMKRQCERCKYIAQDFSIEVPSDLTRIIRVTTEALENGIIENITENEDSYTPFEGLSETGPWDDILNYRFRCRHCGARYELFCDTYHGGGKWGQK